MSFDYPVTLNLQDKKCLVVGGGQIALRKVHNLLAAGARVVVVSPLAVQELVELARDRRIRWLVKTYRVQQLRDCCLVVAATDKPAVNALIAEHCRRKGILVNVVDDPKLSSFTDCAHYRQGDLTIAVSTGGKSPALAARIKEELQQQYGQPYALLLEILDEARETLRVKEADGARRRSILKELVDDHMIRLVLEGQLEEARERVRKCLLQ